MVRKTKTGRIRPILSLVGGNLLSFALILASAAAVGEVWLRLQWPFLHSSTRHVFDPTVGYMLEPDAEIRWTNLRDFWTVSRTNGWGFLDREPVGPERAAASCHVALIGDSFVAAREVPVADKVHVRLEELASRALPDLDVTTSAFGLRGTGQINQLPLYDEFARRLRPRLLVLVFVYNDFANNTPSLIRRFSPWAVRRVAAGMDPDLMPWVTARRNADGGMKLLPPDPDWRPPSATDFVEHLVGFGYRHSWFANWLEPRVSAARAILHPDETAALRQALLDVRGRRGFRVQDLPLRPAAVKEALEFTAFGLDRFKERADRDGAALAILSTHTMGTRGHSSFDRLSALAAARGIPVIDQFGHVRRRGAAPEDGVWAHGGHWNADGHQWAAEALLDHLKRNPEVCARPRMSPTSRIDRISTTVDTRTGGR